MRYRLETLRDLRVLGETANVEDFLARLAGPTLIRVPGVDTNRTRVAVTLLHGNEPSGLRAMHAWLRSGTTPRVNALLIVGNVAAALVPPGFAHRNVPGGRDLNRCFRPPFEGREGRLAQDILEAIRSERCEALVDLHNNTGHNPPYGVGTRFDAKRLAITRLFADTHVHTELRLGSLMEGTEDEVPGVSIETGRAGEEAADAVALAGLRRFLSVEEIRAQPEGFGAIRALDATLRVRLRSGLRLAFAETAVAGVDLTVSPDIDRHNFREIGSGSRIGWLRSPDIWPIEAQDSSGCDRSGELFVNRGSELLVREPLIPIMMTTDAQIAADDCLFYVVRSLVTPLGS
jgi:hypothetical protein